MERLKGGELHISVRSLVEFMLRSGDLDNRFGGGKDPEVMQEGSRIHRKIQRIMGPGYHAEVPLHVRIRYPEYDIIVEGRADGIFEEEGVPVIDEIKSMRMDVTLLREPVPVHEAQAKCYAWFYWLCSQDDNEKEAAKEMNLPADEKGISETDFGSGENREHIVVQMTYCTMETEEIVRFRNSYTPQELKVWFENLINGYQVWVEFLFRHARRRTETVKPLLFPFEYREGQRDMVVSVYRSLEKQKHLFVQAPTGIGKTMSALFPAVKTMGEETLGQGPMTEKIFYLTAKTITRTVAEESFRILKKQGADISFVTLTAKEKICVADKTECNPVDCLRAKGHFDRINDAVYDLITHEGEITREIILAYSEKYQVCPFEMALDVSCWVDGVICDYNYVFDPNARLKRFFGEGVSGSYVYLIDEAHNLVERAREMYSAALCKERFLAVKKLMNHRSKTIERLLDACNRIMLSYKRECENYLVLKDASALALQTNKLEEALGKYLEDNRELEDRKELLDFYFDIAAFDRTYDCLDDGYQIYCEHGSDGFLIKLYCINPANRLKECMDKGNSAVLFSATMLPIHYYKELLTGNPEEYAIYIPSPFARQKRLLCAAEDVTVKYTRRGREMYDRYAEYVLSVSQAKKGNYMVFCPSYKVMEEIRQSLEARLYQHPANEVELEVQTSFMDEEKREAFLRLFEQSRDHTFLALCVLGGIFSEGIDLTADRLIGVFIIGTGLPQVCNEREILKQYFDRREENGFDYAYRYPGMNKVLQAAGRVIRTKEDMGVIFLLDDRFRQRANRVLFPREWEDIRYVNLQQAKFAAESFWQSEGMDKA